MKDKLYKLADEIAEICRNDDYGVPGKACVPLFTIADKLKQIADESE